jgi:aspartate/glutamate racemase
VTPDIEALLAGNAFAYAEDAERYARTLVEAAESAMALDVVFLAQFSMDPYAPRVGEAVAIPVVSALEATLERIVD